MTNSIRLSIFAFFGLLVACKQPNKMEKLNYPVTNKQEVKDDYFGTQVADPYRWLESPDSAAVTEWVEAQNKVTFGFLDKIPFRGLLRERLEKIWNYPKYTAPFRKGDHYFYFKNDGLQNQSLLYIMDSLKGEGTVLIDPNKLSAEGTTSLSTFSVSKNGKIGVYGTSAGGSDWNNFYIIDLPSGKPTGDSLQWIKFSGASWEGNGFYYGRYSEPQKGKELSSSNENKKIYYHKLGTPQSSDQLIYEDPAHPKRSIYTETTEDERFLVVYFSEGATNDNAFSVKDLSKPKSDFKVFIPEFENSYGVVDNIGNDLIVLTNYLAPKKRLVAINFDHPEKESWREILPEREGEVLNTVSLLGGKIVAEYLKDASSRLYVFGLDGKFEKEITLPTIGTVAGISGRMQDKEMFYTFTSFTYPNTIFKYDLTAHSQEIFRKPEVDFNPEDFETKQVFFSSKDGTKIPMFVSHKKGIKLDGNNPTLLYGYGGFNVNILPSFSISNLVMMEKGGIYAVATLRGGGEYGEDCHKAGMMDKKQNVFDDFIGAAEYLIAQKYTSSEKLAIHGGSNGGLLVGAAMCQRPELFKVAIPAVGVMDMLRFHKFTIGHAWVVEYGSSDNADQFQNLYKFSPVHNLKADVKYPATMVLTADHDDRVVPAHSFKFIATLQEKHKGDNPVVIRIDTKAGHGAGKSTTKVIDEAADKWAFMFYNMGVEVK